MTKLCPCCKQDKPLTEYYKNKRNTDLLQNYCKSCQAQKTITSKAKFPEKHKATKRAWYQNNRERVLQHYAPKAKERYSISRQWALDNPERVLQLQRDFRKRQDPLIKSFKRFVQTLHRHQLTLNQYLDLATKQDFLCAVCGGSPSLRKWKNTHQTGFVIDHDHVTNRVRSLLCTTCNVALGMIRDTPEIARKLAAYLEHHSALNLALEASR